jgi:hypothetical protein
MTLGIPGLVPHWSMESHVSVHLDDRAPWRDIRTGNLATNNDIQACLSALDALLLRGSFYAGPERTFLKNVTLAQATSHAASSAAHLSSAASFTKVPIAPSAESSVHDKRVLQVIDDFLCDDESASCMIIPAFGVTGHGRTSGAAAASNRNSIKGRGKKSLMLRMILPIQFASAPWPLHPFYATTLIPPSAPLFSCNCKVSH